MFIHYLNLARNHSALFRQRSLKIHIVCLLKDLKLSQHLTLEGCCAVLKSVRGLGNNQIYGT